MNELDFIGDDSLIVDSDIPCTTPDVQYGTIRALAELPIAGTMTKRWTHQRRDPGYACAGPLDFVSRT